MKPDELAAMPNAGSSLVEPSMLGLFLDAAPLVQLVMIALLLAFFWSLWVVADKTIQFAKARKENGKFEQVFWSGQSLDELYAALSQRRNEGLAALFVAAMREWKRSTEGEGGESALSPAPGVQQRIDKVMDVSCAREMVRLERRLPTLTAIAAASPLAGLFALSWGLMAAFSRLSGLEQGSLGMIAPEISGGLLALALGFLAAILAKIFSVRFAGETARQSTELKSFAGEFSAILSRQIGKSA